MEFFKPNPEDVKAQLENLATQAIEWQQILRADHGLTDERITDVLESNELFMQGRSNLAHQLAIRFGGAAYPLQIRHQGDALKVWVQGFLSRIPAFAFEYWDRDLNAPKTIAFQTGELNQNAKIELDRMHRVTKVVTPQTVQTQHFFNSSVIKVVYDNDELASWTEQKGHLGPIYTNGELSVMPGVRIKNPSLTRWKPQLTHADLPRVNGELQLPEGYDLVGHLALPSIYASPIPAFDKARALMAGTYTPKPTE